MKTYEIPGWGTLAVCHLVLDYNGTTAIDGKPIPGVFDCLTEISQDLLVHIVTADTFGSVRREIGDLFNVHVLCTADHRKEKADYIAKLGADSVVAIGNGRNDAGMLRLAALGIIVVQAEGTAIESWKQADVAVPSIIDALGLLLTPQRLIATLRA